MSDQPAEPEIIDCPFGCSEKIEMVGSAITDHAKVCSVLNVAAGVIRRARDLVDGGGRA